MTKEQGKLASLEWRQGMWCLFVGDNLWLKNLDEKSMRENIEIVNSAALSWAGEREKDLVDALEAIMKHMEMVASPSLVGRSAVYEIAKKALDSHRPPSDGGGRRRDCERNTGRNSQASTR